MSSNKTLKIAFKTGGILPASVMGTKIDERVPAHSPCDVPADYANQLVGDKFAYLVVDVASTDKKAAKDAVAKAKADKKAAEQEPDGEDGDQLDLADNAEA
jgi:hypothetical protein